MYRVIWKSGNTLLQIVKIDGYYRPSRIGIPLFKVDELLMIYGNPIQRAARSSLFLICHYACNDINALLVYIGERSQSSLPETLKYRLLCVIFRISCTRKSLMSRLMRKIHQYSLKIHRNTVSQVQKSYTLDNRYLEIFVCCLR